LYVLDCREVHLGFAIFDHFLHLKVDKVSTSLQDLPSTPDSSGCLQVPAPSLIKPVLCLLTLRSSRRLLEFCTLSQQVKFTVHFSLNHNHLLKSSMRPTKRKANSAENQNTDRTKKQKVDEQAELSEIAVANCEHFFSP
jgi:hypothetical protein